MNSVFVIFTAIILAAPCLFAAAAPDDKLDRRIEDLITTSVMVHSNAKDYHSWRDSEFSPQSIFFELSFEIRTHKHVRYELCDTLRSLSDEDLSLFHEQLSNPKVSKYLGCSADLVLRISEYWGAQTLKIIQQRRHEDSLFQIFSETIASTWGPSKEIEIDTTGGPTFITGDLEPKELLLTFDDGPHGSLTPQLLKILRNQNLQVNFFMVGQNVVDHQDIVQELLDHGHEPGNHTWSHRHLPKFSSGIGEQEIVEGFQAIWTVLGFSAPFFRFPYGAKTRHTKAWIKGRHISEFFWNVDTLDWKIKDPHKLYEYVLEQISKVKSGIVLFHDVQPQTIVTMPMLLRTLKARGYKPVVFRPNKELQPGFQLRR